MQFGEGSVAISGQGPLNSAFNFKPTPLLYEPEPELYEEDHLLYEEETNNGEITEPQVGVQSALGLDFSKTKLGESELSFFKTSIANVKVVPVPFYGSDYVNTTGLHRGTPQINPGPPTAFFKKSGASTSLKKSNGAIIFLNIQQGFYPSSLVGIAEFAAEVNKLGVMKLVYNPTLDGWEADYNLPKPPLGTRRDGSVLGDSPFAFQNGKAIHNPPFTYQISKKDLKTKLSISSKKVAIEKEIPLGDYLYAQEVKLYYTQLYLQLGEYVRILSNSDEPMDVFLRKVWMWEKGSQEYNSLEDHHLRAKNRFPLKNITIKDSNGNLVVVSSEIVRSWVRKALCESANNHLIISGRLHNFLHYIDYLTYHTEDSSFEAGQSTPDDIKALKTMVILANFHFLDKTALANLELAADIFIEKNKEALLAIHTLQADKRDAQYTQLLTETKSEQMLMRAISE